VWVRRSRRYNHLSRPDGFPNSGDGRCPNAGGKAQEEIDLSDAEKMQEKS